MRLSFVLLTSLGGAPVLAADAPAARTPDAVVREFHDRLAQGDGAGLRRTIGATLTFFNGADSADLELWQAHMSIGGEAIDRWAAFMAKDAAPHEAALVVEKVHERAGGAIVVVRSTGRNRFRSWTDEPQVWLLQKDEAGWRVVGAFYPTATNPK